MQAEKSDKRAQTVVSICVLLVLAGIAVGLLITHARYDRGAKEAQPVALIKAGSPLVAPLPAGLVVKTAPERFDRQTLSDKIDGRADYYLPSGFIALTCQRFALAGDPGAWLEMYVYDMGADDNAFAVFTAQRRPTGEPLELTQHSYHAGGSTFFTHGQYYVEIVSPGPSEQLAEAGMALARTFVAETRIDTASQLDAAGLFPPDGLVPDSITLKKADVFGFDGLDNVYTATYYYPFVHKEIYGRQPIKRSNWPRHTNSSCENSAPVKCE